MNTQQLTRLGKIIRSGKLAVLPTDTIYGVVSSAIREDGLKRLREVKHRGPEKAFIVLIANYEQLRLFTKQEEVIALTKPYWPGPVSIILPANSALPLLTGSVEGVAFRIPDDEYIISILEETGPLAAPSANPEGTNPATTIEEARAYFGNKVEEYIDGGMREGSPSKLIKISNDGKISVLRD